VRLEGPELPALDGSAWPFARELLRCSRPARHPRARAGWRVVRPLYHHQGAARCLLLPGRGLTINCRIQFDHPLVGAQWLRYSWRGPRHFLQRLAPARTFGFVADRAALQARGLARGASLGNALVYDARTLLSPGGTRFSDEPVRHKVLDALGDLTLLGGPLSGELRLVRCSHRVLLSTLTRARAQGALVQHPAPPPAAGPNHREEPT
jgi:UDP-3-O-[3-hydroxymyristoyl] N-acetylglucosamine deacetylase